jgi:tetratricopeptide (TPR) repeat protein
MIANLIALALLAPQGKIQLTLNVKDGEVITGERTFRATVVSKAAVTQVEFYVGDELRETDTSIPYEFKIDSLSEKEGNLKLKFSAHNNEGDSAAKSVTVKIDNLGGKTVEEHVDRAKELLQVSKWDEAILISRIALKNKPGFVPAQVVMARAYLGKGVIDSAQKFAEDAVASDAKNAEAIELLSVINLQKAFSTFNRGGDRKETLEIIRGALKAAVENRRKTLDTQLEGIELNDANRLRYSDTAFKAMRYQDVVNVLAKEFQKDNRKNELANRYAYALIREGRMEEAASVLADHKKYGTPDAYGFALIGIVEAERGNWAASDDAMREAVLSEGENMGVRTAQAYLALKKGSQATLGTIAKQLMKDEGQRSEVHLYLTAFFHRASDYEQSRKHFERAVLAEPANYDMYIERANESIGVVLSGRLPKKDADLELEMARILMETALIARPESHEGLAGMALVLLMQNKKMEALPYAQAAVRASPTYPAGHYVLASVYTAMGDSEEATKSSKRAGQIDKPNLEGRELPKPAAAWQYYSRHGRTPLITLPK